MAKSLNKKTRAYRQGLWAENLAAWLLRLKGYRVLARRYKTPVGEIDLVVCRQKTLVAVEVKSRAENSDALESINFKNRERVQRALAHFMMHHPVYANYDLRFDVVAVSRGFSVQHLDNAWQACS